MKTAKRPGPTDFAYMKKLIRHLEERDGRECKTGEVLELLGVGSRSYITDKLRPVTEEIAPGVIVQKKKGYWTLLDKEDGQNYDTDYEEITEAVIRRWLILLVLAEAKRPLTAEEIWNQLTLLREGGDTEQGKSTFAMDRRALLETRFLETVYLKKQGRTPCFVIGGQADFCTLLHREEIRDFCSSYINGKADNKNEELADIYRKLTALAGPETGTEKEDVTGYVHGRSNRFSKRDMEMLEVFLAYPYKQFCLDLTIQTNRGKEIRVRNFETGMIVYGVTANAIYILGKTFGSRTSPKLIRMDSLKAVEISGGKGQERKNSWYMSLQVRELFRDMFSVSVEEPEEVEVKVRKGTEAMQAFQALAQRRTAAELVEEGSEWAIYRDRIRGTGDFMRFVRRYGQDLVVLGPEKLREGYTDRAGKAVRIYEGLEAVEL